MLFSHFSTLAFLSITAAVPTSPGTTQLVWNIVQNPLREESVFSAPAVSHLEETPSALDAASPISLLYEFDDKAVTLENLAARSNGQLILTASDSPTIYTFDPRRKIASLLHTLEGYTSCLGIVETTKDVFIVAAGNYSAEGFTAIEGTFAIWSVDVNNWGGKPTVKKVTDIPHAKALNGMTKVEGSSSLVLVADSALGGIWLIDTISGKYSVAIEHVILSSGNSPIPLGVNGIQVFDGKLYFVNSAQRLYGRIAVDKAGVFSGEPEILAHSLPSVQAWDDLAMDWEGNGWLATHANAVTEVTASGKQRNFTAPADAPPGILHPTSLIFGRGSKSFEKTLFVVTGGGTNDGPTPGQVFAVDTRLC